MMREEVVIAMQPKEIMLLRAVLRWYWSYICPLYQSNLMHIMLFELILWRCNDMVILSELLSSQELILTVHSARTLDRALAIYLCAVQGRPRCSELRASLVTFVECMRSQLQGI